jgi:hypothetical protein
MEILLGEWFGSGPPVSGTDQRGFAIFKKEGKDPW